MSPSAVIYARISRDNVGDHLGVDRQERLCRKLAKDRGLTVDEVMIDNDVSAYRGKRPEFERLVGMLREGSAGAVVCYHADRLYRRTTDLERLVDVVESSGAQVHTVAAGNVDLSTASGRMIARMLGAAAQHESERMGERLRMKSDELAASGRYPGGRPPFGYSAGYVVNPVEAEAVKFMARRVLEGSSLLGLARELDAAGVTTREGRPWHSASVRASLVNPAIAGLRVHRREIAGEGDWPPVLDRATWEEVRAVLTDPARKHKRPARRYLLAGLVVNIAGEQMTGRPDRGAGGVSNRRTYATRAPAAPSTSCDGEALEELIVETVLARTDGTALPDVAPASTGAAEVEAIEAELAELAALRGAGTIALAEWLAARTPLLERLEKARRDAGTARRPSRATQLLGTPGAVRRAWPDLDMTQQREILAAVIDRIVVAPATRGRWTPVADRLTAELGGRIEWRV